MAHDAASTTTHCWLPPHSLLTGIATPPRRSYHPGGRPGERLGVATGVIGRSHTRQHLMHRHDAAVPAGESAVTARAVPVTTDAVAVLRGRGAVDQRVWQGRKNPDLTSLLHTVSLTQ